MLPARITDQCISNWFCYQHLIKKTDMRHLLPHILKYRIWITDFRIYGLLLPIIRHSLPLIIYTVYSVMSNLFFILPFHPDGLWPYET